MPGSSCSRPNSWSAIRTGPAIWNTALRQRLVRYQLIPDDVPIEKTLAIEKSAIEINRGWGLVPERIASSSSRGAWHYAPVVKELSDWKKCESPAWNTTRR